MGDEVKHHGVLINMNHSITMEHTVLYLPKRVEFPKKRKNWKLKTKLERSVHLRPIWALFGQGSSAIKQKLQLAGWFLTSKRQSEPNRIPRLRLFFEYIIRSLNVFFFPANSQSCRFFFFFPATPRSCGGKCRKSARELRCHYFTLCCCSHQNR